MNACTRVRLPHFQQWDDDSIRKYQSDRILNSGSFAKFASPCWGSHLANGADSLPSGMYQTFACGSQRAPSAFASSFSENGTSRSTRAIKISSYGLSRRQGLCFLDRRISRLQGSWANASSRIQLAHEEMESSHQVTAA